MIPSRSLETAEVGDTVAIMDRCLERSVSLRKVVRVTAARFNCDNEQAFTKTGKLVGECHDSWGRNTRVWIPSAEEQEQIESDNARKRANVRFSMMQARIAEAFKTLRDCPDSTSTILGFANQLEDIAKTMEAQC